MQKFTFLLFIMLLSSCARTPLQGGEVQPEVVVHFDWWNNVIQQPVAVVRLWNTSGQAYSTFTFDVCAWNEKEEALASYRFIRKIELAAGEAKTFRLRVPTAQAASFELQLVEYE